LSNFFVARYELLGAAAMYAGLMVILAVALAIVTVYGVRKEKRGYENC